jgi:hypothetical protein
LPAHTHSGSTSTDGNHFHSPSNSAGFMTGAATGVTDTNVAGQFYGQSAASFTNTTGNHSHTFTTGSTGGGAASSAHTNLQPYQVLNPIIYTGV